jgi:signal transduction histidine kinase
MTECTDADLARLGHDADHEATLRSMGLRSFMIVPLIARDRILGAITLASTDPARLFAPVDLVLAQDLAHRAALAIDNARLFCEAQAAIRAREEILGVVSHDLRNPLNTIQLATTLLLETNSERRTENVQHLDLIRRATQQLGTMISDLLDISSIESRSFHVQQETHTVGEMLARTEELLKPLAEDREIQLECSVADEFAPVWADSHQVFRVLSNLVGNALKFSPPGGTIRLEVYPRGRSVCFAISDTGDGIPDEQLGAIFTPYWQGRPGDRRGAGLGLAIARGIVEAHGGEIWAESEVGAGTTFFFTLPAAAS